MGLENLLLLWALVGMTLLWGLGMARGWWRQVQKRFSRLEGNIVVRKEQLKISKPASQVMDVTITHPTVKISCMREHTDSCNG